MKVIAIEEHFITPMYQEKVGAKNAVVEASRKGRSPPQPAQRKTGSRQARTASRGVPVHAAATPIWRASCSRIMAARFKG